MHGMPVALTPHGRGPLAHTAPIVAWESLPPSCEPCAYLNSDANKRIRGSKSVNAVLKELGLQRDQVEPAAGIGGPDAVSDAAAPSPSPPAPDAKAASGQARVDRRGVHKRWQVESFVLVLRRLVEADPQRQWHVVDFGCGTGALLLPLACLFPSCRFTGVEMNPAALAILRQRAAAADLANVSTFVGMIEGYEAPFDVALALHACGNATDAALLRAEQHRAAYVVSPCCVGKLKFSLQGGSSFSNAVGKWRWNPRMVGSSQGEKAEAGAQLLAAAGGDCGSTAAEEAGAPDARPLPPVIHPRSAAFSRLFPQPETQFKLLAQVADTVYVPDRLSQRAVLSAEGHLGGAQVQQKQQQAASSEQQAESHAQALTDALALLALEQQTAHADAGANAEAEAAGVAGRGEGQPPAGGVGDASSAARGPDGIGGEGAESPGRGALEETARKAAYCALAKLHVELDRNEAAREAGYAVGIFRMLNAGW